MSTKLPKYNKQITAQEVLVISDDGEKLGVLDVREAQNLANSKDLDLIEISPNTRPVVCKVGDFGKYKYELQKKESEVRKRHKVVELKEVQFSVNIAQHDYQFKMKRIADFIEASHHVKVSCKIKGRDRAHSERMATLFNRILQDSSEYSNLLGKVQYMGARGDLTLTKKSTISVTSKDAPKSSSEAPKVQKEAPKSTKEAPKEIPQETPKETPKPSSETSNTTEAPKPSSETPEAKSSTSTDEKA